MPKLEFTQSPNSSWCSLEVKAHPHELQAWEVRFNNERSCFPRCFMQLLLFEKIGKQTNMSLTITMYISRMHYKSCNLNYISELPCSITDQMIQNNVSQSKNVFWIDWFVNYNNITDRSIHNTFLNLLTLFHIIWFV